MGIAVLLSVLLLVSGNLAWAGPAVQLVQSRPGRDWTQEKAAGGVTFTVTFTNPGSEKKDEKLAFKIGINTHSVALEQYSLKELLFLRDDQGKEYLALSWQPSGGGHHIEGVALFANVGPQGKALTKSTKYLELVVKNVAGVPLRSFRWQLSSN